MASERWARALGVAGQALQPFAEQRLRQEFLAGEEDLNRRHQEAMERRRMAFQTQERMASQDYQTQQAETAWENQQTLALNQRGWQVADQGREEALTREEWGREDKRYAREQIAQVKADLNEALADIADQRVALQTKMGEQSMVQPEQKENFDKAFGYIRDN